MDIWSMKMAPDCKKDDQVTITTHTKKQWKSWLASDACAYNIRTPYDHDASRHDVQYSPPSKFHHQTMYRVTLHDVNCIANAIQKLLVVRIV